MKKHYSEVKCVKSGVITAAYTEEIFDVEIGELFAVVGTNNGTQLCIEGQYGETTICLLHNSKYDVGTLKDACYEAHNLIKPEQFAEFDYTE